MHPEHKCVKRIYAWPHVVSEYAFGQNAAMAKQQRAKTYLREWRKMKPGRTLEMVASQLGMSQPQLGRIERGDQPYNQDLLEALAELYGCEVPDLLMRDPTRPDNIWSIWDHAKPVQRRLIEAAADAILRTGTGE